MMLTEIEKRYLKHQVMLIMLWTISLLIWPILYEYDWTRNDLFLWIVFLYGVSFFVATLTIVIHDKHHIPLRKETQWLKAFYQITLLESIIGLIIAIYPLLKWSYMLLQIFSHPSELN